MTLSPISFQLTHLLIPFSDDINNQTGKTCELMTNTPEGSPWESLLGLNFRTHTRFSQKIDGVSVALVKFNWTVLIIGTAVLESVNWKVKSKNDCEMIF